MASQITPQGLARSIEEGWRVLDPFRKRFVESIREYLGGHVGEGDSVRRPTNLIAQAVAIILPNLISEEPIHRVRTPLAELRGEAVMLELAMDRLWEDTDARTEIRYACLDAILGPCGIIRLGMRAGSDFITVDSGHRVPVAEPYCRRVPFDDYCCDPAARNRHELRWEAIRYRIPRQEAIDSGVFGRDPQEYGDEPPIEGVATREEAADLLRSVPSLSAGAGSRQDAASLNRPTPGPHTYDLIDTIELWDVFVYLGGSTWTVTVAATHEANTPVANSDKWLLAEQWEGPDPGPLVVFGFQEIPDQPLFKPVVADWRDLHDLARTVSAKLAREIENVKVVWGYKGDGEDDAMSVKDKGDSGLVRLNNEPPVKIEINGVVKDLMPGLDWIEREWANASGNLPLTGGQNSDATDGTATAAAALQANASQKIKEMRGRVEDVMDRIDAHFGWYLTVDPLVKLPLPYRVSGGETVTMHYDAATRRGDFQSYSFKVERYSPMATDPNVRTKRVLEFLTHAVIPMIPAVQMGLVSMEGLARLGQQELGIENLDELLPMQAQMLQMTAHAQMQGIAPSQGVPGQTPGMLPPGGDAQLGSMPQMGAGQPVQQTPMQLQQSAAAIGVGQ